MSGAGGGGLGGVGFKTFFYNNSVKINTKSLDYSHKLWVSRSQEQTKQVLGRNAMTPI